MEEGIKDNSKGRDILVPGDLLKLSYSTEREREREREGEREREREKALLFLHPRSPPLHFIPES
jgi:hypothetical protein